MAHDFRHALRNLRRTPGFTAVALIILTLSIGASTAIFSVVDGVVLRGLPFEASDRLVAVGELNVKEQSVESRNRVAPQNFYDWRDRQKVFTGLAATWETSVMLRREGEGEPGSLQAPPESISWWRCDTNDRSIRPRPHRSAASLRCHATLRSDMRRSL